MKKIILKNITERKVKIGIVGMGYVGLPLALTFVEKGFMVTGIDIDEKRIKSLENGVSFINHIPSSRIKDALAKNFTFATDFSVIKKLDVIIICVPTPLNDYKEPDLSYVESSVSELVPHLHKGMVVCLVSTTYPGTTEEIVLPKLREGNGINVGKDTFLIYSPEREDPGNSKFDTKSIPKIVSGYSEDCLEIGTSLFKEIIEDVVPVSSLKVAELAKLLENIYRAVNIGLVNDMKKITDKMDIDIFEVIDAASTKPFGFKPFFPGPGLGGHCIPIDPFYLSWKSKEFGIYSHFIELAGEINSEMPSWVVNKVSSALNDKEKSIRGSKVMILGLSYKKDIEDTRESPSIEIIEILNKKGAKISYHDSYVDSYSFSFGELKNSNLDKTVLNEADLVLLVTDHTDIDYELINKEAQLIVDTRGKFKIDENRIIRG